MAENPKFIEMLAKMREIHDKKAEDYSSIGFYENFTRQAEIMGWFKNDQDKAFAGLIAVKLARLATILNSTREPNFESQDDTFLDLCTYCGLWASYHLMLKDKDNLNSFQTCIHSWVTDTIKKEKYCDKCKLSWNLNQQMQATNAYRRD